MNWRQKIIIGVTDVLILAELTFAIYMANLNPEEFTSVFFKYFFAAFVPTIVVAIMLVRRLRESDVPAGVEAEAEA